MLERLMREGAASTEIVRFADATQAPVKVVRGRIRAVRAKPTVDVLHDGELRATDAAAVEPIWLAPGRIASEIVSFAGGDPRTVTILRGIVAAIAYDPPAAGGDQFGLYGAPGGAELDQVAFAVDGAESSHGAAPGMWRPELDGPQGPMQVSAAAALDSGSGDRFDLIRNRELGRAYLALLFRRYGNWPDAVTAYNWGPGNLDAWIARGRPMAGLPPGVERYRERVLRDGAIQ
jgi:Transglycosylase SLT domain